MTIARSCDWILSALNRRARDHHSARTFWHHRLVWTKVDVDGRTVDDATLRRVVSVVRVTGSGNELTFFWLHQTPGHELTQTVIAFPNAANAA